MPCSASPGIDCGQSLGAAQSLQGLGEPRTCDHLRPAGRGGFLVAIADAGAGQQPHGLGERQTFASALRSIAGSCSIIVAVARDRSRPSVRAPAQPIGLSQQLVDFIGGQRSPSSVTSMWKSSSASADPEGRLCRRPCADPRPRRTVAPPAAGMRTTTPALSSCGTSRKSCMASAGVQRSGWKISPSSTMAFSHEQDAARAARGRSDKRRPCWPRPHTRRELAERQMLGLGLRGQPRRVGREKGNGASASLRFSARIEMHAADQIPCRVAALEKFLQGTVCSCKLCK